MKKDDDLLVSVLKLLGQVGHILYTLLSDVVTDLRDTGKVAGWTNEEWKREKLKV